MKRFLPLLAPLGGIFCFMPSAHAADGQTNVVCGYHHTLGDDAIMMYGKPNEAMLHDFFGNTATDAFSTYDSLRTHISTTCDNKADSSAYWAPSMRLPDGQILKPSYQKTYYQANQVEKYPLNPFPKGLELLAGDHHGTGPNPHISFLCANGKGYTGKADQVCGLRGAGDAVQFNIGIAFPNCWDGVNLKPMHGKMNAAYSVSDACPAAFPVKIPTVNMNVAYVLPQLTSLDVSKIQLSLDPVMDGDKRIEQWGSIYTAHADFMNGWTEQGAEFMTKYCMNESRACGKTVPYSYNIAREDTYVSSEDADKNFGDENGLRVKDDWRKGQRNVNPQSLAMLKFKIPPMPTNLTPEELKAFQYRLRIYGQNTTDNATIVSYAYALDNDWSEQTATWKNHAAASASAVASLQMDGGRYWRDYNVDSYVRKAITEGKDEVSIYLGGERSDRLITFDGKDSAHPPMLAITAYQVTPEP